MERVSQIVSASLPCTKHLVPTIFRLALRQIELRDRKLSTVLEKNYVFIFFWEEVIFYQTK